VVSPGPESDFSQWVYANQYNVVVVAAAVLGAEVSLFWINSSRQVRRMKSTDYGASWGSPELIDYSPSTAINGIAAAYKDNGDIALFFADQSVLYVKTNVAGSWQGKLAWDKSTGNLSGVATVYSGDWNLMITGKDAVGNDKLWSLVYGDGGKVAAGSWSPLQELATAPDDGDFEYRTCFVDKPDAYRCCYIEKFGGTVAYSRPFWSHSVGPSFLANRWREPVPFDLSAAYGLAIAHHGDSCWLSSPGGVWRAAMATQTLDLTGDVLIVKKEISADRGRLVVELRNDQGQYATPGAGDLVVLDIGCQLDISPGYITASGGETGSGQGYILDAYEHTSAGGKASLILYADDGWAALGRWRARHQFRWNRQTDQMSIGDLLARVGLQLEVRSQSATVTGSFPDFTVNPGNHGETVIGRLLSLVPDLIFIEGNTAYLVNPLATDESVYSYGMDHVILTGNYRTGGWPLNWVQVEGVDTGSGDTIIHDSFQWQQIDRFYDRLGSIEDSNLGSVAAAQARGQAVLRQSELESASGSIRVPVNCGQQLYDVVDITDSRAGFSAVTRRVRGILLVYNPQRGQYQQQLFMGAV